MRRFAVPALVLLALAGAVVGGVALERYLLADDEAQGITDAEHGRLLETCMAAASDDPGPCSGWVAQLVDEADEAGCGYVTAAEFVSWYFSDEADDTSRVDRRRYWEDSLAECET